MNDDGSGSGGWTRRPMGSRRSHEVVSNEEYIPLSQTREQERVAALLQETARTNARRLGVSRRDFLSSSAGMAAAFVALNTVFGRFFEVDPVEAVESAAADARKPSDQFIFDVQTHHVAAPRQFPQLLGLRRVGRPWNPELDKDAGAWRTSISATTSRRSSGQRHHGRRDQRHSVGDRRRQYPAAGQDGGDAGRDQPTRRLPAAHRARARVPQQGRGRPGGDAASGRRPQDQRLEMLHGPAHGQPAEAVACRRREGRVPHAGSVAPPRHQDHLPPQGAAAPGRGGGVLASPGPRARGQDFPT